MTRQLVFFFIEKDSSRFQNMRDKVLGTTWPTNFRVHPVQGAFAEVFTDVLSGLEERGRFLAPAFIFVDPFGPEGFPTQLLCRLLQNPKSELLINLDYNGLNRWYLNDPSRHAACDELFGSSEWRQSTKLPRTERERALVGLYTKCIEQTGAHTLSFRMVNRQNQPEYYLVFASKHPLGLRLMKDAMWKADPSGGFAFSDMSNPLQPRLLDEALNQVVVSEVAAELLSAYKGQAVSKSKLEEWADFHPTCRQTHLTEALKQLEDKGAIAVSDPLGKRRRFTYPKRVEITFCT